MSQYFARLGCAPEAELEVTDIPGCAVIAGVAAPYVGNTATDADAG
jgi:hypothetical protein